jgi:hypothetical protein
VSDVSLAARSRFRSIHNEPPGKEVNHMAELTEVEYIETLMADLNLKGSNSLDDLIQALEEDEEED